ncbi:MAG: hypothetical protein EOO44_13895 [Flavobacterium sp.]|nr:MAG: hypothetical protein EOO44_13895 [Flavobacterium sp.]
MKDKRTALDTLYFVNESNKKVSLEIITGGLGQTSTFDAKIEGILDIKKANGSIPQTIISDNKTLNGKILTIACTITDTSRDTNYTELRIRLNGGIMFVEYPLFANVENEGDTVDYRCVIRFFNPS